MTDASAEHISDQLWACCDEGLEKAVYNTGLNSSSTEEELLCAMKSLAVRAQNNLVNVVKFFDMAQEQEEPVGAFSARLKGLPLQFHDQMLLANMFKHKQFFGNDG